MAEEKNPITFNVLGACVSRNIFNVQLGNNYKVQGYVFLHNPLLIFQIPKHKVILSDDELNVPCTELVHPFYRQMFKSMIQGNAKNLLLERKGDWIILDTFYEHFPVIEIKFPNDEIIYQETTHLNYFEEIRKRSSDSLFKNSKISIYDARINIHYYIDELANFLDTNWHGHIILLNPVPAQYSEASKLLVPTGWSDFVKRYPDDAISCNNEFIKELRKRIDCFYIDIPFPIALSDNIASVHYEDIYKEYQKKRLDNIINNYSNPGLMMKNRDNLDIEYYEKINEYFNSKLTDKQSLIEYSENLAANLDGNSALFLGRLYRDGDGVKKNLKLASIYLKMAAFQRCVGAITDYLYVLDEIGTSESYKELFAASEFYSKHGNVNAMLFLARAYRDGNAVKKNVSLMVEWYEKAISHGISYAIAELLKSLWDFGTPEASKALFEVASKYADAGNNYAMAFLGREYFFGRYVSRNLERSADCYRKAVYGGIPWADIELFEVLWKINRKETDSEMFIEIKNKAEKSKDGRAIGLLGKCYHYGRGTKKDLQLAARYTRMAFEKNVKWAQCDLFDILWEIHDPETYPEMLKLATVANGVSKGELSGRLARMYMFGVGVEKDRSKAEELYNVAISDNISWAISEYEDIKNNKIPKFLIQSQHIEPTEDGCGSSMNMPEKGVSKQCEELFNEFMKNSSEDSIVKAFELCKRHSDENWARVSLAKLYYSGLGCEKNCKKSIKCLLKCNHPGIILNNGVRTLFCINEKILDCERIVLYGNLNEIKLLWTLLSQHNVKSDCVICDEDVQVPELLGKGLTLESITISDAVVSVNPVSFNIGMNFVYNCARCTLNRMPLLEINAEVSHDVSIVSDSETGFPIEILKKNIDLHIVDESETIVLLSKNPVFISKTLNQLLLASKKVFIDTNTINENFEILYAVRISDPLSPIEYSSIGFDEIYSKYLIGKSIYNSISQTGMQYLTSSLGAMGDQYRRLARWQGADYSDTCIIVNHRARYLPEQFGINGLVLSMEDSRDLQSYILLEPEKKFNVTIVDNLELYPGLSKIADMYISTGEARIKNNRYIQTLKGAENCRAPMVNIGNSERVVPGSILIVSGGVSSNHWKQDLMRSNEYVFTKIIEKLKNTGKCVYVNSADCKIELPNDVKSYAASISEFVEDSPKFDFIVCMFTGFMEVAMFTGANLAVISPMKTQSRRKFAEECLKDNYYEYTLNIENPDKTVEEIMDLYNAKIVGTAPRIKFAYSSEKYSVKNEDFTKEKLRELKNETPTRMLAELIIKGCPNNVPMMELCNRIDPDNKSDLLSMIRETIQKNKRF